MEEQDWRKERNREDERRKKGRQEKEKELLLRK